MPDEPIIHETRKVARSQLFTIEAIDLEFSNGQRRTYERMGGRSKSVVVIIPMLNDETVLLIREYAVGIESYQMSFAKGLVETGEDILEAANRELQEEVGVAANKLTPLMTTRTAPGYSRSLTHIVLAQDLYESRLPGDEPELIEVLKWPLSEFDSLLQREDFCDSSSQLAWYRLRDAL